VYKFNQIIYTSIAVTVYIWKYRPLTSNKQKIELLVCSVLRAYRHSCHTASVLSQFSLYIYVSN